MKARVLRHGGGPLANVDHPQNIVISLTHFSIGLYSNETRSFSIFDESSRMKFKIVLNFRVACSGMYAGSKNIVLGQSITDLDLDLFPL
jgi:hypothetical protein